MEEGYHATIENRFYPDMSKVNRNITVEAKLISPPMHFSYEVTSANDVAVNCRCLFRKQLKIANGFMERSVLFNTKSRGVSLHG